MIFADKLILLRKKQGWSQEELAEKMNVSRQAVTKWEGAQSIPEVEKIIKLSSLFGVSTDYLLKDDIEQFEGAVSEPDARPKYDYAAPEQPKSTHRLSIKQAKEYLDNQLKYSGQMALGVFLCIVSPICIILLGALNEQYKILSENAAAGIGISVLLVLVAFAVSQFVLIDGRNKYKFLDSEDFEIESGVYTAVKQRMEEYKETYTRLMSLGTSICVLSAMPIFLCLIFTENDFAMLCAVCITLLIAAIGVYFIIKTTVVHNSFNKIIQDGEFTPDQKKEKNRNAKISPIYWSCVTAIYLAASFLSKHWEITWVVFPIAALIFPAAAKIANNKSERKE